MAASTGAALVGGGLLAGGLGSYFGGQAAQKGSDDAIAAQMAMFGQSRRDFMPWMRQGQQAIGALGRNTPTSNQMAHALNAMGQPLGMFKTEMGRGMPNVNIPMQAHKFKTGFDPTFDPTDPVFTSQQAAGEEAINRALAARGKFRSSEGINALAKFNRELIGQEGQRQFQNALTASQFGQSEQDRLYNRRYQKLSDLYGRKMQQRATGLNEIMNLYNLRKDYAGALRQPNLELAQMGMGAAGNIGQNAMMTAGNVGQQLANQGAIQGNFLAGLGALPMNMMGAYGAMGGNFAAGRNLTGGQGYNFLNNPYPYDA